MSNAHNTNNEAEKKVLCKLVNHPNLVFDLENSLGSDDFFSVVCKNIFVAIKDVAVGQSSLNSDCPIDPIILEEKVASVFPEYYKSQVSVVKQTIEKIFEETQPADKDFIHLAKIILNNSIKRKFLKKTEELKRDIETITSPDQLANHIEVSTLDFTSSLFRSNDIGILGGEFESWLNNKFREVKEGRVHIGVKFGFPNFESAIGGGFRDGTVNIIAARSKMGKSFLALTIADNVASHGIPVLYLDTELDDEYQTIRRVSKMTKIPMYQLETGQFIGDAKKELMAKNAISELKKQKIYYVDIKGWSLEEQVSIIRRFFAKIVGKNNEGRFNRCLVILDYLKLMSSSDKNNDKEYEALGYRMTAMHDLMGEFKSPMLALAQQNREGLEKEDESTISGSDRIIHYCDNFTIFSRLDETEIIMRQNAVQNDPTARKPTNCKLKVVNCRHGSGTKGRRFIGVYADIHDPALKTDEVCGVIEERSVESIQVIK